MSITQNGFHSIVFVALQHAIVGSGGGDSFDGLCAFVVDDFCYSSFTFRPLFVSYCYSTNLPFLITSATTQITHNPK